MEVARGTLCRVALKRGDAVSREVMKTVAEDKKMSKQEKEERYRIFIKFQCLICGVTDMPGSVLDNSRILLSCADKNNLYQFVNLLGCKHEIAFEFY